MNPLAAGLGDVLREQQRLLGMLGDPATDPRYDAELRALAAEAAKRIGETLRALQAPGPAPSLVGTVEQAAALHDDLPVDLITDLARGVLLAPPLAALVSDAVTTFLVEVRARARARHVVVHADVDSQRRAWEVVLRDDGEGFDLAASRSWTRMVHRLAEHAVAIETSHFPGEGNALTLRGALVTVSSAAAIFA